MGRGRLRGPAATAALLLAVAGCGSSVAAKPSPTPAAVDTPISNLFTAAGIDQAHAQPIRPGFQFLPSEPQVTAIVFVGRLRAPASLSVAWLRLDSAGREHALFTQQILVTSHVVAWSTGRSPGLLAVGAYRIRATLAGQHQSLDWAVVASTQPTPAASSGVPSPRVPTDGPRLVASWIGGDATLDAAGSGPPQSGGSGSVPEGAGQPTPSGKCIVLASGTSFPFAVEAGARLLNTSGGCKPGVVMLANMQGEPAQVVGRDPEWIPGQMVNPCGLAGGRSTPGSVVQITAISTSEPSEIDSADVTLIDWNILGPLAGGPITPAPGTRVKPGQTISGTAVGFEYPPTTGIHTIDVTVDGTSVAHVDNGPTAKECDPLDWSSEAPFTYRVPNNPPGVVHVHEVVTDRAGKKSVVDALYPTGQQWTGTIISTSDRHYFEGGANYTCTDAWTGTLSFTVDGQNAVTGSGALNLQGVVSCTNPYAEPGPKPGLPGPSQAYDFSVSGEKTTGGFNLQFAITSILPLPPPGSIDVAGIQSLLHVSVCPPEPGPKFSIHFDRPNHASGVLKLNATIVRGCSSSPGGSQNDIFSSSSTIVLTGP
jgi:hypothetical protein